MSFLLLSAGLVGFSMTAAAPSQSLPKVWNRAADWIAQKNPTPDSQGNLV